MNKKIVTPIFLFLAFINVGIAQTYTLQECRNLAIENNNSLKVASQQERIAHYEKKEALLMYFPKVSAMGAYMHMGENMHLISSSSIPSSIKLPIPIPNWPSEIPIGDLKDKIYKAGELDMSNIWVGGINVTQPIYAGGKIVAANDIRAYAQELAKTMKETQVTNVIVEVDEAYWQVVSIANKKKLAESYVELLQKMDSDVGKMLAQGVATKADQLTVSVKLNEAEMSLTKATNGLSLSKMLLCQICGLEIDKSITVADENMGVLAMSNSDLSLPSIDDAIEGRSEIKSLAIATKIYEKKERIVKADFLPTVGLMAGYTVTNPNMKDGIEHNFGGLFNVAVMVKVPLNVLTSSAKMNVAKAETTIKRIEMDEVKEKIRLQINQSVYKLDEANKKMAASKKNTQKAEENMRYANVGFKEGVIPSSDVLGAHTAWVAAHSELIDAQIDLKLCSIYLNKALGRKIQ